MIQWNILYRGLGIGGFIFPLSSSAFSINVAISDRRATRFRYINVDLNKNLFERHGNVFAISVWDLSIFSASLD